MRRKELEITDKSVIERIINNTNTIRLGIIADNMAYTLPMVFGYEWISEYPVFYMHCGVSGRKNQGLIEGARVSFEIDIEGPLMTTRTNYANNFSMGFCCIMGEGTIHFANDSETKKHHFSYIMKKLTHRTDYEYQSGWLGVAKTFYLKVDKMSASQKGMNI